MQTKRLEDLIEDMEMTILMQESELEYLKDSKSKNEIQIVGEKIDQNRIDQIGQQIAIKEEQIRGLKFVTGKYAERLAIERTNGIESTTEKSS